MDTTNVVVECKNIHHWFDGRDDNRNLHNLWRGEPYRKKVLHDINIRVLRGEIIALVGPSGCGKSTLLKAILGTHPPRTGEVLINGEPSLKPGRHCGIVYQAYSLFPFLTALENVALGPLLDSTDPVYRFVHPYNTRGLNHKYKAKATKLLEELGLGSALHSYPHEMSGGMRQRTAIAQALIMEPEILLLDEPFGALDETTREECQRLLLTLYMQNEKRTREGKNPYTILIVTHELSEAILVSDRVIALSQYWDWNSRYENCPGATVVYDCPAPVYPPDVEKEILEFTTQKNEIKKAAFDPKYLQSREIYNKYWKLLLEGG
jgi:NitT/TauT family transport system ATP-binding protein